jgi:predicted cation transporter
MELTATLCFGFAIVHTFFASYFKKWAGSFKQGTFREELLHLLGEVEVVFGLWSALFLLTTTFLWGRVQAVDYLNSRNFDEPIFVFVILACAATRPVISVAEFFLLKLARLFPGGMARSTFVVCLILGPLLGSFMTEPAAMTLTALIMKDFYFSQKVSLRFKYLTLAVLFVNVSVGGALTPYAAPPILMVAQKWNLNFLNLFSLLGWRAILVCVLNAALAAWVLRPELKTLGGFEKGTSRRVSWPVAVIHLFFLAAIVIGHRHPKLVLGLFLFFLGFVKITPNHQSEMKVRESLLVAFFLAGLVLLGGLQSWWLKPAIESLESWTLFLGSIGLTAIVDNAALTYLGAQVPDISESFKYALLAGALTGGGLTVIANAPNPAGYAILQESFGSEGIKAQYLILAALVPTLVSAIVFWFL